eukprot:CAMPEP_0172519074 /NCGR_PEP_ID=MMETSP1066-20121228/291199_1 /TAXON_ID=671091 /ORGANISM="Coscinodiscus wailesii, Strain CCMP2513" /LENGTH=92 /DNA_ID=CAMNT_0013301589 /DNA_START=2694 /DNA_END=2972 /DNA_ORIENTATION=+
MQRDVPMTSIPNGNTTSMVWLDSTDKTKLIQRKDTKNFEQYLTWMNKSAYMCEHELDSNPTYDSDGLNNKTSTYHNTSKINPCYSTGLTEKE